MEEIIIPVSKDIPESIIHNDKKVLEGCNTNIIVITNKCNFNCNYCFEQNKIRKDEEFIISEEQIRKYIDNIISDDFNSKNPMIVIFGGEPLLAWERIKYLCEYAYSKNIDPWYSMNTNGYRFKSDDFFKEYIQFKAVRSRHLITDISFDGVGQIDRVLKSGKNSTDDLINIIFKFKKNRIPFRLSYTVHDTNENICVQDIKNIIKLFRPERLTVNLDYSSIKNLSELNKRLSDLKSFKLCPICSIHCNECSLCNSKNENYKYYNIKDDKIFVKKSSSVTSSII